MRTLFLMPVIGLMACTGPNEGKDDTGPSSDDSNPDSEPTNYEEGCITVDGSGGYKYIQDAIKVADEGSVILLCDGTYEEAVTVDKGVTIQGTSREGTIVSAPSNAAAFDITASGATVTGLTILTSKDGLSFTGATNSTASDITITAAPNYGVLSQDSSDITIDNVLIDAAGYTGAKIGGGSVTISNSTFESPVGFGVVAIDGAEVTLSTNVFNTVVALADDGTDGFALSATGATAHLDHNTITSPAWGGVLTEDAVLTMDGDIITNPAYGVLGPTTELDAKNVQILDPLVWGIAIATPGTVTLTDTVITTTPEGSCEVLYDDWFNDGSIACGAFFAAGGDITVTGGTFSGFNNYGLYLQYYDDGGDSNINVTGATIDNVARFGMRLFPGGGQSTLTNVTITNLREPELVQPCRDSSYIYPQQDAAIYSTGNLVADGLILNNNQGWGLSSWQGFATITNSSLDGNACSGLFSLQGSMAVSNSTFLNSKDMGGVYDYQGASVISDSEFSGGVAGYSYDSGPQYVVISGGSGRDVQGYLSQELVVENSSFASGDVAVAASDVSSLIVSNITVDDYNNAAISMYTVADAVLEDVTVTNSYGLAATVSYSTAEINNLTVSGQKQVSTTYSYYSDADDSLVEEDTYTSSSSTVLSASTGTISANNIEISEMPNIYYPLYFYDSSFAVDGLSLDWAYYLMYGYAYSVAPDILLENVEVGETESSAMSVYNYTTASGSVVLNGVEFGTTGSSLYFYGPLDVELTDVSIGTSMGRGVDIYNATSATIDGFVIDQAYSDGLSVDADSIVVTNSMASTGYSNGLVLANGTVDVTGNVFTDNSSYGMTCSGVTISACSGNDLSNNGLGEHSGCDDLCGQ